MKKISMITLLMALMGVAVANPVSQDVARRVAQNWMQAQGMKNVAALQDITQQTPFAEFYVFAAPEGGFVLVSGDDCVQPVLAYSTVNRFEAEGMPQHVRGFLEGYDKEIRWWKTHVQPAAQVYASRAEAGGKAGVLPEEWQRLVDGAAPQPVLATAVAPLLTTTWDQSPYYNALCPTNGGESARAVTGCVATATAQVMKYHNHPATGYGSHTYSSSRNVNGTQYTYNNLSANFGATTYQWSQMPNALTSASTTAQVNAVATLMYHIGVANEMAYSPEASGSNNVYGGSVRASSQHSLMKYFKYRADMAVVRRDDYSHDDYCQRLRAELDQSRPLLYEGSDESGGHSFVLDGYNNSGYFHVNWGWGGYFDDYYAIGGLEPAGGGTGANMGSYNLDNDVLIGLRPHTAWSATGNTTVSATVQAGSPSGAAVVVMGGGDNNYGTQSSTYAYGDTVMIVASAPNGYRFDSWNDGDRNNPRYLVANGGSYSFTASYAAIPTDTVSYCNSDAWLSAYSLGSDKHWGVMFPASLLDAGKELSAVMFYAYEAGTYNITVYTGSNRETTAATVSHVVGSDMTRQWQTVALPTAVAATQDVWITFYAPNVSYPAAFTNYSGVDASCLVGSSFDLYGGYWLSSFMVKGVFTEPVSCDITSFPYTEDFEDVDALGCWRIYDGDGDGHTWTYASNSTNPLGYNSNSSLASASYDNNAGPLTPDNWLIAPSFVLPAGSQMHLKWQAKGLDANYASEYYSVYVSTTGNAIGDFTSLTPVYSGTTTNAWVQQDVDLSAYAGQTVYVAFRHHNCTDMYYLLIDDVEVSAGVAPQPTQYTLTVVSNNTAWGTVSGGGTYNAGATATLTATAATGYHFVQWQDGNTQNPRTVAVTGNATYTATFAADAAPQPGDTCAITSFPYTMDFEGGVTCWSLRDYNQNDTTWGIINGYGYNGSRCAYVLYQAQADDWLMTPRVAVAGTYTVSWKTRAMSANYPETYQVWAMGSDTSVMIYSETLSDTTYVDRMATFTVPAGDSVLVMWRYVSADMYALFLDNVTISQGVAQYTITANSSNAAWGTVSGGGTYNEGATATLTATAATGYRFVSWQDGNTQNPRTVTVTGNATYTATFEAIPPTQYTLTVSSNNTAWGTVTGGGTYNADATATLTATAATGYHFVQWQDGNTQNPRTVTVTANATYTATFAADAAPQPGDTCAITSFPYTMDFESDVTCWSLRDYNQNDTTWGIINGYGYNGSRCAYVMYQVQADDWLMTPRVAVAGTHTVSWKTRVMSANYPETYQVWAMGNDTSVMIFSETLTDTLYVDRMATFTVPAGDSVNVMWRYISADMYALFLDDVTISQGVAQYTITANSSNAAWGTVSGGGTYSAGATATLTATAAAGYHFVQWQDGNTQNPRTVTVTGNATYTATFASDASCAVTSFPWTEGFEGGIGACWSTIDNNNDGYGWEALGGFGNNGSSYSAASYSYVNGVGALTPDNWLVSPAIVVPATGSYDLSWAVSASNNDYPEEHYAVYVATAKTVAAFTATTAVYEETLTAAQWATRTVSLAAYAGQTVYVAFRHYNCTDQFFMAIDDVTITAGAAPQPTQYTLTVASNNTAWGTVTGGGTYNEGATVTLTATAATGYRFVSWQDGNTQNPRTVTVTGNATYKATFEAIPPTQYTITATSNNTAWGTVSGGGTYNEGATATLTATAATGYRFVSWQDGNTQNPRTVTVTGNATYTATFEAIPPTQYTLTVVSNNTAWGTVSGGGTYNAGATATLTATAATGYHFVSWQDGNTENPRTVTVTANATYVATFADNVGIDDVEASSLSVAPNPATVFVEVGGLKAGSSVSLVDINGKVCYRGTAENGKLTLDVSGLAAGVYFVHVSDGTETAVRKLVVK